MSHCPTCTCSKQAPDYPVTCDLCGVTYGPGGEVSNHRRGGVACNIRHASRSERQARMVVEDSVVSEQVRLLCATSCCQKFREGDSYYCTEHSRLKLT